METQSNQLPIGMPQGNMPMVDDATPMDDGQMPMDNDEGDNFNPYDTNFDAGIDTNEEDDPKRYIQQLTGKLSQSLRKYQQELPTPDADLDKYVAGMILKQTTNGLDDKEVKDILGKMKDDEDTNESVERENTLNELFQELTDTDSDDEGNVAIRRNDNGGSYRKLPFTSPNFN